MGGEEKRRLISQGVSAAIIIALIFIIGAMTALDIFDTKRNEIKNAAGLLEKRDAIERIYRDELWGVDPFIDIYSLSQVFVGSRLFDDSAYGYIIMDTSGKLHFPAGRDYKTKYGESVADFNRELESMDIPFLYVQAPNKKLKGVTEFPAGGYNYSNEDADDLLLDISASGTEYIDLRDELINDSLDTDFLFYITDHHWTTKTSFWAYTKLVAALKDRFGLDLDPDNFYRSMDNYTLTEYKKSFLGAQGRRVGKYVSGVDDYTFIAPDFGTYYEIYDMISSPGEPIYAGSFYDSIAKREVLENPDITTNRHGAYFEYDYGCMVIKNKSVGNNIKLMLIKDSFSLPLAAFLSTSVSEIHMLDLRDEDTPKPSEYVKDKGFDAVLIVYNTEVFNDTMFSLFP